MVSADTSLVANIGQTAGVDPSQGLTKAYSLKELINQDQIQTLQLNEAKSQQAKMAQAQEILSGSDLSTRKGQMEAGEKLMKLDYKIGSDFSKEMNAAAKSSIDLTASELSLHQERAGIVASTAQGLLMDYQDMLNKGVNPQIAGAQMQAKYQQQVTALLDAKLEDGSPVLDRADIKQLVANPQFNPQFLQQVARSNMSVKDQLEAQQKNRDFALRQQHETAEESHWGAEEQHQRVEEGQGSARLRMEGARLGLEGKREALEEKKFAAAQSGGLLDDDTISYMATQGLQGDKSVFQNLGRGAQGAQNIVRLRKEMVRQAQDAGMSPKDLATKMAEFQGLTAGERTLGQRTANVEMAVNEAYNMTDLALAASDKVPRSSWVPVNKAIQAYEKQSGDPSIREFGAANNSLVNAYARAISPSGVATVSDKDHARELLSTADSPEAYHAVVAQMKKEMEAARRSPGQVREEFRTTGGGPATASQQQGASKAIHWDDLK